MCGLFFCGRVGYQVAISYYEIATNSNVAAADHNHLSSPFTFCKYCIWNFGVVVDIDNPAFFGGTSAILFLFFAPALISFALIKLK